jgi:O-antigen/teichoic acid export membrane protein
VQEPSNISYSGKSIARNTVYNLLGYFIPMVIALFLIPPLIRGLGDERFGILNLAWIVIGYFSFFDFGIGKSLTKVIAEKIGGNRTEEIPAIFWTSLTLMLGASVTAALCLSFFIPSFMSRNVFNISAGMLHETSDTFYLLAFSIPIVSTTAGLRGVLEAYQKFASINILRSALGISTFLGPLLVLILANSLFWIVFFLIIIRAGIWVLYLRQCFKVNINLKNEIKFHFNSIKPVLKFSIWITLANIIGPLIIYSDRMIIGALISATALIYYATPYEIITKLLIIPGALVGVLFPVFSASYLSSPELSKKILIRGLKIVFLVIYPVVFIIISFSYEAMNLWLGEKFAENSAVILQLLSFGILMNSISLIPNNFFQGIGKPRIPTLVNLAELPVYIFVMWFAVRTNGTEGAALAFMIMAAIDAVAMYSIANKLFAVRFENKLSIILFLLMIAGLVIPFFIQNFIFKIVFTSSLLLVFILTAWKYFLSDEEKHFIFSKLRPGLSSD